MIINNLKDEDSKFSQLEAYTKEISKMEKWKGTAEVSALQEIALKEHLKTMKCMDMVFSLITRKRGGSKACGREERKLEISRFMTELVES